MRNHVVATRSVGGESSNFAKFTDGMDETKVIDDKFRWSTDKVTAVEYPRRNRGVASSSIVLEGDELDEGDDEDNSEEVAAVRASIIAAEPSSGDSVPSLAEEVKSHERDDQDEEKSESSVANLLRGGESSPPHSEAKGHHSDGEYQDNIEM